jgi:diguanylate cyclase (GGDEF)-like protein
MIYFKYGYYINLILDKLNYNAILLIVSFFALIVAIVSYPRIYKFKILISGYILVAFFLNFLIANNDISYLQIKVFDKVKMLHGNFGIEFLFWLFNLNLLAVILVPSYINYSTGKNISPFALVFNVALFISFVYYFSGERHAHGFIRWFDKFYMPVNILTFVIMAVLSAVNIEEEHNYGSIVVSMAIVLLYANYYIKEDLLIRLLLLLMALILIAGIFYHWMGSLLHKAQYDPLLKIYNRQYMNGIIDGVVDVNLGKNFSVLLCDIDHFKKVNDTHGHMAGDRVLYKVGQIIRDTSLPDGVVCRYGGEEIIVFLRNKIGDEAEAEAKKINAAVKKHPVKYKSKSIPVRISIGAVSSRGGSKDISAMLKKADDALYKAKKTGRDKVVMAD